MASAPATIAPPPPRTQPWWDRYGTLLGLALVAALFALPLRGLLRSQGPPMEEGFMLVFPERVLRGDIANRDFLHLYGPGSLWTLAAVFKVFGTSLAAERLVGLLQQVGLVLGLFALARQWSRTLATFVAVVAVLIILPPIGLTALAWTGAVALGVWAVYAALRARRAPPAAGGRWALLSGVLAGVAVLYRPDLVLATTGGVLVALWGVDGARRRRFVAGGALGLAPYAVHVATAGLGASFRGMVLDPVFHLRGGRRLPIPPPTSHLAGFLQRAGETFLLHWPLPTPRTSQQLAAWFWLLLVTVAFLLVVAVRRVRRDRASWHARVLLTVAVFSAGLLPQALQRTDSAHFAWVGVVPLGFLPVALWEVVHRRAPRLRGSLVSVVAGIGALLVLLIVVPTFTVRRYADYSAQTFGVHRLAFRITYEGRTFYYGRRDVAEAVRLMLPAVDRLAPRHGRLLVGTGDLRKTPYSDAFLYYLLPRLTPATYYIEMDPGVANRPGSRLASDVASSDVVILSTVWDDWDEPNDSRRVGSAAPGRVLAQRFRLVHVYGGGLYRLYARRAPRMGSTNTAMGSPRSSMRTMRR